MDRRQIIKGGIVAGAAVAGAYTPPSLTRLYIPAAAQTLSPLGSAGIPPLPEVSIPNLPPLPTVTEPTVIVTSICVAGDPGHRAFLAFRLAAPTPISGMLFIDSQFLTSALPSGDEIGVQIIGFHPGSVLNLGLNQISIGQHTADVRTGLLGPVIASATFTVTAC